MDRESIISPYLITLVLAGLFLFSYGVSAAPIEGQQFGDWRVSCNKSQESPAESCHIVQQVVDKKGELVAKMVIWYPPRQESPVAIFTLPLGIYLPSGMGLKVNNGSVKHIAIDLCTRQGCQARITLDKDLLETIKQGNKAIVSFSATRKRKMTVTISLTGVTVGIYSLTEK